MKASAQFIGRIAAVKYEVLNNTSTGRETPRLTLQIITSKLIKVNNKWEERTSSFFVSVWNKLATTIHTNKTMEKGFLVELSTEISTRTTQDQYGNTNYFTDFNLETFTVIQKPQSWFENRKSGNTQAPQDQHQTLPGNNVPQYNNNTPVANMAPPVQQPAVQSQAIPEGPIDDDIPF